MNDIDFDFMKHQLHRKDEELQELQKLLGQLRNKYEETKIMLERALQELNSLHAQTPGECQKVVQFRDSPIGKPEDAPA